MRREAGPLPLSSAFEKFAAASATLERSHGVLVANVKRLEGELALARTRLESELAERRRAAAYLEGVLDALACGVIVAGPSADGSRRISKVNREAVRLLGAPAGELLGRDPATLPEPIAGALASLEAGSPAAPIHADVRGTRIEVTATRLAASDAGPLGDVALVYDVTAIRRLEESARRRSRLEAMGRLSAEIAHEIRNPLGSLDLTASLLRDALADQPDHRELVDHILLGVQMLNAAVVRSLSLARPVRASKERLDAAALTREVLTYLLPVAASRKAVIVSALDGPAFIDADRELFRQLALNLVQNALEAAGQGGTVRIGLARRATGPVLTIRDDGIGIAPEDRPRIFEPLFTRKKNGTGLGLAVVQRAADEHGWRVGVRSAPGRGTTVTVELFARRATGRTGRRRRRDGADDSGR
ncbi:MAG: hypothetical protein HY049_04845 [Acidobacteria bacterium]|nr:hypothetical protein [Acidobacteriota bacterium]